MQPSFLIVVQGASRGAHATLHPGGVVIGREAGCDLQIADARASRRHVRVISTPTGARVEDLGSTNGTLLNDAPLTAGAPLVPRDRIRIGDTIIELQVGSGEQPTAEAGHQPRSLADVADPAGPHHARSLSEIPGRRAPESVIRALAPVDEGRRRAYALTVALLVVVAALVAVYLLTR